jgi:cobalt-zinc-cadmium efflux system membrane fusion protein
MKTYPSLQVLPYLLPALLFLACGSETKPPDQRGSTETAPGTRITLTRQAVGSAGIRVGIPSTAQVADTIIAPASLLANQDMEAHVGSFIAGRVTKVFVTLGASVRRGQPLMQIEGLEIGEIKARYITAKSRFDYAKTVLDRQQALSDQNIGAKKAVFEATAEFEKARAEFIAEDRKIHSIGMTDSEVAGLVGNRNSETDHSSGTLNIIAPIDGMVVERNVVIGQQVDVNTTAFCIINAAELWADAQVQEKDAARISGMPEVRVDVASLGTRSISGKVIHIGETVDERTRTIRIRAAVRNSQRLLKPRMYAHMHIPTGSTVECMVLSDSAVVTDNGVTCVFVAVNDSTFDLRPIRLLGSGATLYAREGLAPGERVVTAGAFLLKSSLRNQATAEE